MGMTAFYGKPMPDADAIRLLQHLAANGVSHWDTAEVYKATAPDGSDIYNESIVGKGIKAVGRCNVEIATKIMPSRHGKAMTPEIAIAACRASCERLQVDHVDLYYVHRPHPSVPVEQQAVAMKAVRDAGLARHIGVSEFSVDSLRRFHAVCPITCVQQEWSLLNRDLEEDLVPVCRELGIGIVAYSPLSRALLTGELHSAADLKEGDLRASRYPRLSKENIPKNAALAKRIGSEAGRRGVTPAQLALAWVANQGDDVVPIPGTTSMKHLNDNLASRSMVLTKDELSQIAALVPHQQVTGDRYPEGDKNTYKGRWQAKI